MKNKKLKIIDQIENTRKKNNKNWMDILRIAFEKAPEETALIMSNIYKEDSEISKLVNGIYLARISIVKLVVTVLPEGSLISKVFTVNPTGKVDPGGSPAI